MNYYSSVVPKDNPIGSWIGGLIQYKYINNEYNAINITFYNEGYIKIIDDSPSLLSLKYNF